LFTLATPKIAITTMTFATAVVQSSIKQSIALALIQLRVLRLGLLQDGNVWIGVFPERKKVLIGSLRLGLISRQRISYRFGYKSGTISPLSTQLIDL
jgi:hypothetical protein